MSSTEEFGSQRGLKSLWEFMPRRLLRNRLPPPFQQNSLVQRHQQEEARTWPGGGSTGSASTFSTRTQREGWNTFCRGTSSVSYLTVFYKVTTWLQSHLRMISKKFSLPFIVCLEIGHLEKKLKVKNSKLKKKLNNSNKKLKVLANFNDRLIKKYLKWTQKSTKFS